MKPRLVGIDISAMHIDDVLALVNSIRQVLPAGPGQQSKIFEDYRIRPTDMLRLVLGVPTAWLSAERIQYAHAMHQLALRQPPKWTRKPGWEPVNPRGVERFDAATCVLDREFLSRFAITDTEWNADVFRATDFLQRLGPDKPAWQARAYLALTLFGFTRAEAFFVAV